MRPVIGITTGLDEYGYENSIGISYVRAIENAGGTPILLPLAADNKCLDDFLAIIDGLLLSGGVDIDPLLYGEEPKPEMGRIDAERDRVELYLSRKSLEIDMPVLAICRGIQTLNVAAGGTLYQDIPSEVKTALKHRQKAPKDYGTHTIDVKSGSQLLEILGQPSIAVNSFHHQAVKEIAPNFIISAVTRDGIIEGIESSCHSFAIGVQFHPELMWQNNPPIKALFAAFVDAAKEYKQQQSKSVASQKTF